MGGRLPPGTSQKVHRCQFGNLIHDAGEKQIRCPAPVHLARELTGTMNRGAGEWMDQHIPPLFGIYERGGRETLHAKCLLEQHGSGHLLAFHLKDDGRTDKYLPWRE